MNAENTTTLKKIATHSGSFHTDDVFACAVLALLNKDAVEIVRSRDPEVWATCDYVVDVGGEYDPARYQFDHHQQGGAGTRENGIPYSAFGLVWKEYGEQLTGSKGAAHRIDEKLVQPVDARDYGIDTFKVAEQGVFPYLLQSMTFSFHPTWKEEDEGRMTYDEGFACVVNIAKQILTREITIARDNEEGERVVVDLYNKAADKRVIVIDGQYPWEWILMQFPEPLFIVKHDHENGGKWKVKTVRVRVDSFESRKELPESWAGKRDEELAAVTGVPDAVFCHNKRWIAVAGSKEGALKLAELALAA